MQLLRLLHKTLSNKLVNVHKKRMSALFESVSSLLDGGELTLTSLGRHLPRETKVRSNIRKLDRLLNNAHLQSERRDFYKVMNELVLPARCRLVIHIDWSCVNATTGMYVLRASTSLKNRALVIYEESYPKHKENSHAAHKAFLQHLKALLPEDCVPIIVTDAGFRAPWFSLVRELGWDFIGRLRHKNLLKFSDALTWQLSSVLHAQANSRPQYKGEAVLTQKRQVPVRVVLYKDKPKGRHKLTNSKRRSKAGKSRRFSRGGREPWVLVTSLAKHDKLASQTVTYYRLRMRIEENFRDTKCARYGFGLNESRSRSPGRINVLLLIAAIASFAAWIAGGVTSMRGQAKDFQAQSARFQNALSCVFLGRQVLQRSFKIGEKTLLQALKWITRKIETDINSIGLFI